MSTLDKFIPQVISTILSDVNQWSLYDRIQITLIKDNQSNVINIKKGIADIKQWCLINSVSINMDDISPKVSSNPSSPDHLDRGKISWAEHIKIENIILIPHSGKKANNKIIINGKLIKRVPNSGFDLLYYLFWLKKHKPNGKEFFSSDEDIPKDHLKKLLPGTNIDKLDRFDFSWAKIPNPESSNERDTQQSKINTLIKKKINIPFNVIVKGKKNHHIPNEISNDKIELISYSEMM